ncbi:hypothetical protein BHYA_0369g00060 [Botrytis hyacinthi]|uniref:Uncharacterized protein n=1 Tax=Botrytis hyacinthi TaxID=278943 RepID=A0A4Z1GAC0_9HELO|nr:hypothetical protein BHYA_0369g00060 [Botrytis hyacinthi]
MFSKIKKTFRNHASGKQQSEDGVPLPTRSEQLRTPHQGTRQSNMNASPLLFLPFSRRQNNGDSRNRTSVQETRVPQTPQYAPSSPHHSPRRSQHSSSRSIQSNENGFPSTSTLVESVVSRSSSHHTTANADRIRRNPREVVVHNSLPGDELRSSSTSRDERYSSIPRFSTIEGPNIRSRFRYCSPRTLEREHRHQRYPMGFFSIITSLTPGDARSTIPRPRREESDRGRSQRTPPFSLPLNEAPPPSYESLSTTYTRPKDVELKPNSHRATARAHSGGLVALSGPSSRSNFSRSLRRKRPHSSCTTKVDHRFSQALFEESRHSSGSEPDPSHEPTKDRRRSTTGIRSEGTSRPQTRHESTSVYDQPSGSSNRSIDEASRFPRSAEQAQVTTGFVTYDEWWSTRSK